MTTSFYTPILLNMMGPFVGALIYLLLSFSIQTIYNLFLLGGLKLLKVQKAKKIFWTTFALCSTFTLFVAVHNVTNGALLFPQQTESFMDRENSRQTFEEKYKSWTHIPNYRIQPLTIFLGWTVVSALTALTLILINKKKQDSPHG